MAWADKAKPNSPLPTPTPSPIATQPGCGRLRAEGKKELLPLIGELGFAPELGYTPTDAEKNDPVLLGKAVLNHLKSRANAVRDVDPAKVAAALLLLDNISEPALLAPSQIATLPRANWLQLIATTRLGPDQLWANPKSLALLEVDSLSEDDALELLREHQPSRDSEGNILADPTRGTPGFASTAEESAARELVRELGGFTLAVEQVAVFLGLHPEITPSTFLAGLRQKGLSRRRCTAGQTRRCRRQNATSGEATRPDPASDTDETH